MSHAFYMRMDQSRSTIPFLSLPFIGGWSHMEQMVRRSPRASVALISRDSVCVRTGVVQQLWLDPKRKSKITRLLRRISWPVVSWNLLESYSIFFLFFRFGVDLLVVERRCQKLGISIGTLCVHVWYQRSSILRS